MADGMYRIAIVGAASLAGKELADELGESLLAASDVLLLDEDDAMGKVASVGEEAAVIQPVEDAAFARKDFVFFAGDPQSTRSHWGAAKLAGASIVDLSDALEEEHGVVVRGPFVQAAMKTRTDVGLSLSTAAVVSATPAAVILALIAERLRTKLKVRSLAATIFEPASEHGREAMDELHQQTVNLLAFQSLPRDQYDAQVAFNVLPVLGESAKVDLKATAARVLRHYNAIAPDLPELSVQLVNVPVFHGYCLSVLVDLEVEARSFELEGALDGEALDVVSVESDPPSNLSAAGQEDIMVLLRSAAGAEVGRRFWLWVAADNLKLRALNAIACANELRRLRPRGSVQ